MSIDSLVDQLKRQEGFKAKPYKDTKGIVTFGHGLTWIAEDESEIVVRMRVYDIRVKIMNLIWMHSPTRQDVLVNMAYNLGINGLIQFKRMWAALEQHDYEWAAKEILDSEVAREQPRRYNELAEQMRKG